jgi:anti-sigma regulatory factor (Ser/Thr protein kinase)
VSPVRNGYGGRERAATTGRVSMTMSEFRLPPRSTAPKLARATVSTALGSVGPEVADEVELLTSEVVTNAIRHARVDPLSDVILRVDSSSDHVRVEVLNPGPSFDPPVPSIPGVSGTGLGLFLVDSLARAWGVDREGSRTKVWFEISKKR